MKQIRNLAIFMVVFVALILAQFYYWHSRNLPRPVEEGPAPMSDAQFEARMAGGGTFIRFFYTDSCDFSRSMFAAADRLSSKYPVERINAAKYCWSGTKVLDCPSMVPAFVIYRNGERIEVFGERDVELIENVTIYGKAALAGVLGG